jgi:5-methylcytosine-specific restriction endonuclease McrA
VPYSKEYRLSKIKAGLCVECGAREIDKPKTVCETCLLARREKSFIQREERKSLGLCPLDGKPAEYGRILCTRCNQRQKANSDLRKKKNQELGVCTLCAKNSQQKHSICRVCFLKIASKTHLGERSRWQELENIFDKQKGICPYTGRDLILGDNASLDHIIPKSKGGNSLIENLQWVYFPINSMKLNHFEEDFIGLVREVYQYRNRS